MLSQLVGWVPASWGSVSMVRRCRGQGGWWRREASQKKSKGLCSYMGGSCLNPSSAVYLLFDSVWWFSHSVVSDSFATPWTVACQAPLSVGFSRQKYWSGFPYPSSGRFSRPRDWTCIFCDSCLAGRFSIAKPPGKPIVIQYFYTFQNDRQDKPDMLCYHSEILHYYWLYSPHCAFYMCDSFILQLEVCASVCLTYFPSPSGPSPLAITCLFSISMMLFLLCCLHTCYFLDYIFK